jgi:hypothetical protein
MNLELTDEQTAALLSELDRIIDGDRYALLEIGSMTRPEEVREPLPRPKSYSA